MATGSERLERSLQRPECRCSDRRLGPGTQNPQQPRPSPPSRGHDHKRAAEPVLTWGTAFSGDQKNQGKRFLTTFHLPESHCNEIIKVWFRQRVTSMWDRWRNKVQNVGVPERPGWVRRSLCPGTNLGSTESCPIPLQNANPSKDLPFPLPLPTPPQREIRLEQSL